MTIPLQTGVLYGPVSSRRFGRSLGVNLLPNDRKACNFDCVYCQYGSSAAAGEEAFPSLDDIACGLEQELQRREKEVFPIDWIMIAGNGEPTVHPRFSEAIERILRVRDKRSPKTPIGILSNSSTCHRPEVAAALSRLDGRFMKLDAGGPKRFSDLNRPRGGPRWQEMIDGLRTLGGVVLQSLFVTGPLIDNTGKEALSEWIGAVSLIRPASVQIYSIDRPTEDLRLWRVPPPVLRQISEALWRSTGIRSSVFD